MNGIHDMGGLTCFGPVLREQDEPVFHADWERRVFALMMLTGGVLGPVDSYRYAIERMDPVRYLETTYYEHWLAALQTLIAERGVAGMPVQDNPLAADVVAAVVAGGVPATREGEGPSPRFAVGDAVVAKNLNPHGHTRLPRYVRGRRGTVAALQGTHVFPDTAAQRAGEHPQPLYSVRFDARELWGPDAHAGDCLYIDLWDSYLEAAPR
ncbi:MAG: nitrile hydratase subunit beta [Gammaproteobacteria bacterium]